MTLPTPAMPDAHLGDLMPGMFYYAKWMITQVQPYVMLYAAICVAAAIVAVIFGVLLAGVMGKKENDDEYEII